MTHGGQIVMSHAVHDKIKDSDYLPALEAGMAEQRREIAAM